MYSRGRLEPPAPRPHRMRAGGPQGRQAPDPRGVAEDPAPPAERRADAPGGAHAPTVGGFEGAKRAKTPVEPTCRAHKRLCGAYVANPGGPGRFGGFCTMEGQAGSRSSGGSRRGGGSGAAVAPRPAFRDAEPHVARRGVRRRSWCEARRGRDAVRPHSRPNCDDVPNFENVIAAGEREDGPRTDSGVVIQRELPRMRPHPDRVDLFLALVPHVRLDQPGREHVALAQERVVGLERIERGLER